MELLEEIDWLKSVYDGRTFLKNDSILNGSSTFKIVRGKFANPLLQIAESDEKMKNVPDKKSKQKKIEPKTKQPQVVQVPKNLTCSYFVPGFRQLPLFPQESSLSPAQHKTCIKVIQSNNSYCTTMPKLKTNDSEVQLYNNLIPVIHEERKLFLEHIKSIWITRTCRRYLQMSPEHELLIDNIMKKYVNTHKKYPQFYQMACMFPLIYNNNDVPVEISLLEDLLEVGELPQLNIPSLSKKYILPTTVDMATNNTLNATSSSFLVSEDENCENFAVNHKANIVISSNGLKVLSNNVPPYTQFWDLPILVKCYPIKGPKNEPTHHTVVFIDKSLPVCNLNTHEKSLRCYKLLLKSAFLNPTEHKNQNSTENEQHITASENESIKPNEEPECSTDCKNDEMIVSNDDFSDEENLVISECGEVDNTPPPKKPKIVSEDNKCNEDLNKQNEPEKLSPQENKIVIQNDRRTTYKLWKIGQTKGKNLLCKDLESDIKIIVRCKIDGYETNAQGEKENINIVPKLEYQIEYGAELTTPSETAHHWSLLQFRPNSKVVNVRIISNTGEIVMIEKLPLAAMASEAAKQGLWKSDLALGTYFSVFSKLSKLQPGQYLLRHEPKHHAFAVLYGSVSSKCENGLDLQERTPYSNEISINQTAPWTPIDPNVVTPNLLRQNTMPCMFKPGKCKLLKAPYKKKEIVKKKKKKYTKFTKKT